MKLLSHPDEVDLQIQSLRRDIFIDHSDAQRIARQIEASLRAFRAGKELGHAADVRGVVILGRSGTGKTASVHRALASLGLPASKVGAYPRAQIYVSLRDDVTLRKLRGLISLEYGWTPKARDSAEDIWQYVVEYIERLSTEIIVLDEIQHVRAAGEKDRQSMRDALKSLVQPQRGQVLPVLIGTPAFAELLNSDQQFRRRFNVVHMTDLDPAVDASRAIRIVARYCEEVGIGMDKSVTSRDFARRLLHASYYALRELCEISLQAVKAALVAGNERLELAHFQTTHSERFDCLPEMNPFVAQDYLAIPTDLGDGPEGWE
ncbi:TniB family NTP-binding protein [Thioclava sp. GXIMD4215]|uniref:TniB family NTP-binding protein n=1 Tax=Thioclava sp. GXIMD4215 TaxID=3131928 RepID=UPI00311AFB6F